MKRSLMLLCLLVLASAALAAAPQDSDSKPSVVLEQERYVAAVNKVLEAYQARDRELFESYFTKATVGLQPHELWQRASTILAKFGPVQKMEFSEMDGDAAFVKVHFERAVREFVVQFDDTGKLRELTYVPPAVH